MDELRPLLGKRTGSPLSSGFSHSTGETLEAKEGAEKA